MKRTPTKTFYLPMRDGARLGVDVFLPKHARTRRVPSIVHFTRYFRGITWRKGLEALGLGRITDVTLARRNRFLDAGYAWVSVDARGSGASFGSRPCEWSNDERRDQVEILDWIVRQPWSSGRTGAIGVSYSGTCAEFLRIDGHPSLKAVAPLFSLFDVYEDVANPGGLQLAWFTKTWGLSNDALDRNELHRVVAIALHASFQGKADYHRDRGDALQARVYRALSSDGVSKVVLASMERALSGVRRVEGDEGTLAQALCDHEKNYHVHESASRIVYRDDRVPSDLTSAASSPGTPEDGVCISEFSPHTHLEAMRASNVAILNASGWHDAGYANAAIKRHKAIGGRDNYLLLGPWDHGGTQDTSPYGVHSTPLFDQDAEYTRFFDAYLQTEPPRYASTPCVRYFTMGSERWNESSAWPPPETRVQTFHLAKDQSLTTEASDHVSEARYRVDGAVGSGVRSRWRSLIQLRAPVGYSDRRDLAKRMLTFTTAPLGRSLEITGNAWVELELRANGRDAAIFAYLEEVLPNGRVQYITEGCLRAIHRAIGALPHADTDIRVNHTYLKGDARDLDPNDFASIGIAFHPTSYRLSPGSALRLSLAGADVDHFAPLDAPATEWRVRLGGSSPSCLHLPIR